MAKGAISTPPAKEKRKAFFKKVIYFVCLWSICGISMIDLPDGKRPKADSFFLSFRTRLFLFVRVKTFRRTVSFGHWPQCRVGN